MVWGGATDARVVAAVAIAATAFAVVCGAAARADEPWRHGTMAALRSDAGFAYMAAEGGFAKTEGLDLRMQPSASDTAMMKALIAGDLDSYEGSPTSALIAGSTGADVKIIGCTWPKLTFSLFAQDGVATIGDLRGRKLGISRPGALSDLVARTLLRQAGVAPADTGLVAAGSDQERLRAVAAGTIDATLAPAEYASLADFRLKTLAFAGAALPRFLRECVMTRGDVIRTRRPFAVAFLVAEMNALAFALTHRDRETALTRRIAGLPPGDPLAEAGWREVVERGAASPAAEIDLDKLRWLRDLLAEDGRMPAKFDPAAVVDTSVREAALARVSNR